MTQSKFQISSAAVSDKGLSEKRPQNEDSFLLLADSGMFAVADGVGGAQAGDVASEMAVEVLGEAFINLQEDGDAEDRMKAAISQANASIYQMSRDLPSLSTMATTLVAVHIHENIATIGHVGDSRLYRLDNNSQLLRETQDHSVVEEEVRAGRMTPEQAATHPSRNVISRALGAEATVEIDMKTIMFEAPTTFLVCSDGVTRHIPDDELRELLLHDGDVSDICDTIKEICYERGAEDNLTAVVARVEAANVEAEAPFELEIEDELPTVATARAAASASTIPLVTGELEVAPGKAVKGDFELDDIDGVEDIDDFEETEEIVIPTKEGFADPAPVLNEDAPAPGVSMEEPGAVKDVRSYRVDEEVGAGFVGKLLSGLVWLLVGVLIGAVGYFLYSGTGAVESVTEQQGTQAIVELEQKRRLVDLDPAKYIATYSTGEENSAGFHYMIGRAYLIQENYGAAKTSFEKAAKFLNEADVSNRSILKHDIAVGMAIANDEAAQKAYEQSNSADLTIPPAPDGNTNGEPEGPPKG